MMPTSNKYDGKLMAPYKGYRIEKTWEVNYKGKAIPGTVRYTVVDEDDDWIGDVYMTLKEAHDYIDELEDTIYENTMTEYEVHSLISAIDAIF